MGSCTCGHSLQRSRPLRVALPGFCLGHSASTQACWQGLCLPLQVCAVHACNHPPLPVCPAHTHAVPAAVPHMPTQTQELKKKELDELDAIFSELGISVEEQAKRDAEAEKKRKKKEKKKAAAAGGGDEAGAAEAANGSSSSSGQQPQQAAAEAAAAEQMQEEEGGEVIDPAVVSLGAVYAGMLLSRLV